MTDAILVPGRGIAPDGTIPERVKQAVRAAVVLSGAHTDALLIFSGRWSYKSDIEYPVTEAAAMAAYAREIGADSNRVLVEERSFDMLSNFLYIKDILKQHNCHSVHIVAARDHEARMRYVANLVLGPSFRVEVTPIPDGLTEDERAQSVAREAKSLAIIKRAIEGAHVALGDDAAIWRVMRSYHPVFAKDFQSARRQLMEEMDET